MKRDSAEIAAEVIRYFITLTSMGLFCLAIAVFWIIT